MSDDESEEEEERNPLLDLWPDFEPVAQMPTSRLQVSARGSRVVHKKGVAVLMDSYHSSFFADLLCPPPRTGRHARPLDEAAVCSQLGCVSARGGGVLAGCVCWCRC